MNIKNMHIADQFGHIKAQIAELEEQESAIKKQLIAMGQPEIEGELFRVTVSLSERSGRDKAFQAKIEELIEEHLSKQYITAHTTSTPITTVRSSTRKGVALKVLGG